jgi:DNA-binding IscR family transcriptional regulator
MITAQGLDIQKIRSDFPMLESLMNGKPLVYLDNAATAQKPRSVIERLEKFYRNEYATVHRGVYNISQNSTEECNLVREKCRRFLNAAKASEIIFVRGATEAINLVATAYGLKFLKKGDEIVLSVIEHHSNIVPWQQLALEKGLVLRVAPVNERGELIMEEFKKLLALRIVQVCVNRFAAGLPPLSSEEIAGQLEIPIRLTHELLDRLAKANLVNVAQGKNERERHYQPARDIGEMTLQFVIREMEKAGTKDIPVAETPELESLRVSLNAFDEALRNHSENILLNLNSSFLRKN